MDVSAIGAYKPQYDWRNMTAKEIIKHEDDGDKVPAMYLQWAREFLNSVYSDDVTTYEVAVSRGNKSNKEVALNPTPAEGDVEGEEEEPKLSEAEQLRQELQESGVSLRKQANIFRKKSSALIGDMFWPLVSIDALKGVSGYETFKAKVYLSILDRQMNSFLRNLKLLKDASNVQDSEGDHDAEVERAQKAGQRLNETASKAHNDVSKTEIKLDDIGGIMAGYYPVFDSGVDYGGVTVDIGKELSGNNSGFFFWFSLAYLTILTGTTAINMGNAGYEAEADGQGVNNENLGIVSGFHDYIAEKSGIEYPNKEDYTRDKNGNHNKQKLDKEDNIDNKDGNKDNTKPPSEYDPKDKELDSKKTEDLKKEDKELPKDREQLVKVEDGDKNTKKDILKNASKSMTISEIPSKKEFADDDQQISTANQLKTQMQNDGADERTITLALRSSSKNVDSEAVANMGAIKQLGQDTQASYNELNESIQELMNEINNTSEEIKNAIRDANSGNGNGISRINELNEEIRRYGMTAQNVAGSYEGIINNYGAEIDNIGAIFSTAIETGGVTAETGAELIANSADRWLAFRLVNEIIGGSAITIGNRTRADGVKGIADKSQASAIVNSSLLSIASMKSEIQAKTGVDGSTSAKSKVQNNDVNNDNDNSLVPPEEKPQNIEKPNLEKPKDSQRNENKAIKIAQNDGTDTEDKLHTDINAIIARKIRHGEVNMG